MRKLLKKYICYMLCYKIIMNNHFMSNLFNTNANATRTTNNVNMNMNMNNNYSNQNYTLECDNLINNQINMYLYASYAYLVMSTYFSQNEISMLGLSSLFKELSTNTKNLSILLINYQQKNSKSIKFSNIDVINTTSWTPQTALKNTIDFEISINTSLQKLYNTSNKINNNTLSNFIQTNLINLQLNIIRQLNMLFTQLKLCNQGNGLYIFDQNLLKKYQKNA